MYLCGGSIEENRQPVRIKAAPHCRHSSQPLLTFKTLNCWSNQIAYQDGLKQGFDEVLFFNERGEVCEGCRSNIFWIYRDELYTPDESCGLLPGICRAKVLELAGELGIIIHTGAYPVCLLPEASEVFLTNSLRGIRRVISFENSYYPDNGPVAGLLSEAYNKRADAYILNNKG